MKAAFRSRRRKEADFGLGFLLRVWLIFATAVTPVLAQSPPPPLRPARDEISLTFWERYGSVILIAGLVVAVLIIALKFLLGRPQYAPPDSPEVAARRALMALQNRSENDKVIMEASQTFRRYVTFAFNLPPEELTTAELERALQSNPKSEPALAGAIINFLRQCDEEKFALHALPPHTNVASRALELLEKIEAQRRQALTTQPAA